MDTILLNLYNYYNQNILILDMIQLKNSYLEFTGDINDMNILITYHLKFIENTTHMMNLIKLSIDTIQNHQVCDYLEFLNKLIKNDIYKNNQIIKESINKILIKYYLDL
jgi:hypothetical protein